MQIDATERVMMLRSDPIVIERCKTDSGEIQLQRRGEHYELISNGVFLMATYNGESERLLVRLPLEQVKAPKSVLIGGLGVGFSLAEALKDHRILQVTVVEIEQKIIEWNQGILAPFSDHGMKDRRTRVVHADLTNWIQETEDQYDVICLDIDNGPDWTVTDKNRELYRSSGLKRLKALLRPEGMVAFWSASPSPAFQEQLALHLGEVQEILVENHRAGPDCLYLARPNPV